MKTLLEKIAACKYHVNLFKHKNGFLFINREIKNDLEDVINSCHHSYTLVTWPDSQSYMEEDWFAKEAVLYQTINEDQEYLSSAYFIPNKRLYKYKLSSNYRCKS